MSDFLDADPAALFVQAHHSGDHPIPPIGWVEVWPQGLVDAVNQVQEYNCQTDESKF
jgi:hypothetical protein